MRAGGPPPPPDMFAMGDFGSLEHTGGIPPWRSSPLVSNTQHRGLGCVPPDYNHVCDPTGT